MGILNRILEIIFEPFKWINLKAVSEKSAKFFTKYPFIIYILAMIITYCIFYIDFKK